MQFDDLGKPTKEKMEVKKSKRRHNSLKLVELIGFVGCRVDLEIASYILSHTMSLEKIIIDPRHPYRWTPKILTSKSRSRVRQHLETRLPLGTQLVVL